MRIYVPLMCGGGVAVAAISLVRLAQAGMGGFLLAGLAIWTVCTLVLVSSIAAASWVLERRWRVRQSPHVLSLPQPTSHAEAEHRRAA